MRILAWIFGLAVAVVIVVFALSNREAVNLALWPLDDAVTVPTYLAVLVSLLAGIVIGWAAAAAGTWRARSQAKAQARRAAQLERDLTQLRQERDKALATPASSPTPSGKTTIPS